MKKKNSRKMNLAKETLATLEARNLKVAGVYPAVPLAFSLSSSHRLQSSSAPSHVSRPSGVTTHGRINQGGLWRTCCP